MSATPKHFCLAQQNQLLLSLPTEDKERWHSRLEIVELTRKQVLHGMGRVPEYVYFPTTAVVSLISNTRDGETAEVAVVGNDGVVAISWLLGAEKSPNDAVVQSSGRAYRISIAFVKAEMDRSAAVLKIVMRYAQSVLGQMAQTAVCNRYHTIEQQLCRRLLTGLDRLQTAEMDMTHELAAHLLGVRREGVTVAAKKLQDAGLIRYHRGHVVVLDRAKLERKTCECYAVSSNEYRRLFPVAIAA